MTFETKIKIVLLLMFGSFLCLPLYSLYSRVGTQMFCFRDEELVNNYCGEYNKNGKDNSRN